MLSIQSVIRCCQLACFVAAIAVFRLAVFKLSDIASDAGQILIGLLAAIACTLLLIVLGLLLPITVGERASGVAQSR
jgi:hypothetical protein